MKTFIMAIGLTVALTLGVVVVNLPKEQPETWLAALQVPAVQTSILTSIQ